ncbi:hypothetical protein FK531_11275 [Rhodococcus spelaei]|uniref:Uncharacterized protein n=1 Tax=Rhodococcus spelaei TaxID=2546320 RepID=A0A541BAE4_9NOCA|nr:hypothetical protein [Rhodococcus spelaei]TQF69311.1 hypothetical protein FK531_11275 [Rhodococcus spelaei]
MTTVTVTVVNATNEELLLDPVESVDRGQPGDLPQRIGPHAMRQFHMNRGLSYLLGGDADRPIYLQVDGAVWGPPTCVIRAAADGSGLEVQVSPAPWLHAHRAA